MRKIIIAMSVAAVSVVASVASVFADGIAGCC